MERVGFLQVRFGQAKKSAAKEVQQNSISASSASRRARSHAQRGVPRAWDGAQGKALHGVLVVKAHPHSATRARRHTSQVTRHRGQCRWPPRVCLRAPVKGRCHHTSRAGGEDPARTGPNVASQGSAALPGGTSAGPGEVHFWVPTQPRPSPAWQTGVGDGVRFGREVPVGGAARIASPIGFYFNSSRDDV